MPQEGLPVSLAIIIGLTVLGALLAAAIIVFAVLSTVAAPAA